MITSNGESNGIATVCPVLSSRIGRSRLSLIARDSENYMKKQYKETKYSKKLRDPRWQKKRLEVMERDEFHCQKCFDGESTLNVHHCYYDFGNDPWDYPLKSLVTLCEVCHEEETHMAKGVKSDLVKILCQKGFLYPHFHSLVNGLVNFDFNSPEYDSTMLEWVLSNPGMREIMEQKFRESYLKKGKKNG